MADTRAVHNGKVTNGDIAVDGLFHGVIAGVLMALYLTIVGVVMGEGVGTMLGRFWTGEHISPVTGGLLHLATSGIYGMIFALIWHRIGQRGGIGRFAWLAGIIFAMLLFTVAELIMLPAAHSPLLEIPAAHFAVGHLIYGLCLGFLTQRGRKSRG